MKESEGEKEEDCVMCTIMKDGVCKNEFLSFDACFDRSVKEGKDESECEKLVRETPANALTNHI